MIDITDKKHIIFDFDKTLFWLDLDWDRYFNGIEAELRRLDTALFNDYLNDHISWSEMQNTYVKRFDTAILRRIRQNSATAERELLSRVVPNEEIIDFIRSLDPHIILHIWSSNSEEIINYVLHTHDLLGRFETIVTRSDVKLLKPYPDGFLRIASKGSFTPSYLMVGNSEADRLAAEAVGIDFHLVTRWR